MLVVPIKRASSFARAEKGADIVEIRLDLFSKEDLARVAYLRRLATKPLLFTAKKIMPEYFALKPEYIDLPYEIDYRQKRSRRIASFHNFETTPDTLESRGEADLYKVVTYANSSLDSMRMLYFLQNSKKPLIAFCMGEYGRFSREVAPIYGSWSYVALSEEERTAAGQLLIEEFRKANKVYALLGESLEKSPSHIVHNGYFAKEGIDALYTKITLTAEELPSFFTYAKELGFAGFSVTKPLKRAVTSYLHNEIAVCNTIVQKEGRFFGYNTDGRGALNALEKQGRVAGKEMVILGAGGSAYAIGKEAIKRGARVTFVNRTYATAEKMAAELGGRVTKEVGEYEILVNATSLGRKEGDPLPTTRFIRGALVLEIVHGDTPFLQRAKRAGCQTINGFAMFMEQGKLQYEHFFYS